VSGRAAATHGDAGLAKLMAHGCPGNAQLGTSLAQTPTLGVQVGATLMAAPPSEARTPAFLVAVKPALLRASRLSLLLPFHFHSPAEFLQLRTFRSDQLPVEITSTTHEAVSPI
jgi:hypothetical protein